MSGGVVGGRTVNDRGDRKTPAAHKTPSTWGGGRLPIGPFRDWLLELVAEEDTLDEVAERIGVHPRQVYRWLHVQSSVSLDRVDGAFCHFGDPGLLNDLYPFEAKPAARTVPVPDVIGDGVVPTDVMLRQVREFACSHPGATYAEYCEWAKRTGAVCGGTVRLRCGGWLAALAAAGVDEGRVAA